MNALSFIQLGSVYQFMMENVVGIRAPVAAADAGFKKFTLRPYPSLTHILTSAKGHYDSARGRIEVDWNLNGNVYVLNVTIPPNTTADVWVAGDSGDTFINNGSLTNPTPAGGFAKYLNVPSGRYVFTRTAQ